MIADAFEATALPVTSILVRDCVKADAATDFSALVAVLEWRIFDAVEATFLPVDSDFAIGPVPCSRAAMTAAAGAESWQIRSLYGIALSLKPNKIVCPF